MKVGVRCCFVVGRPPAKFHRIRSPLDAPTYNYSGTATGLTSDVSGLRKLLPGPLSLLSSQPRHNTPSPSTYPSPCPESSDAIARSENPSLHSAPTPHVRARNFPGTDPGSRHRCVRIIPKHLQNVSVLLIGLPCVFFSTARF